MAPEAVLARVLGVPRRSISADSANTTLANWDSLNHVTLILELESAYDVSFSAEEALEMTSVVEIKRVLRSHGIDWDDA